MRGGEKKSYPKMCLFSILLLPTRVVLASTVPGCRQMCTCSYSGIGFCHHDIDLESVGPHEHVLSTRACSLSTHAAAHLTCISLYVVVVDLRMETLFEEQPIHRIY